MKTKRLLLAIGLWPCLVLTATAQSPVVKIDFDQAGRATAEVTEPGYTAWVVPEAVTDSLTVNGIKLVLKKGTAGTSLGTDWYKAGIQSPSYARLVCDGVTVKDGNAGGEIELRIKGLPAGQHTLLTYHNNVQAPANTFSPIDILVNGVLVTNNLVPTNRALLTADARISYLTITAQANTDVVVLFRSETTGSETIKNVIINGLELNTPNATQQARLPVPGHQNEHVEAPSNNFTLGWTSGPGTPTHQVYFGTDSAAVANATTTSPLYKGCKANAVTTHAITGLYSMLTYYWRVDEVLGSVVTKGNVWMFRTAQKAFPDAEGYGRYARGGRGGKVVEVTNLNDDGPGSLRAAVTNDIGPRTIVFTVSGVITLSSRLVLSQPYVTVAGQTAPGKGICIRAAPFGITGNDAVVRHMRLRLGKGTTYDGMGLTGANYSIMDHCSISWTIDEAFSSRNARNITLQRTLISEALNAAGHQNYPAGTEHGYAATIGGDTGSFHHNLLAHCYGRNWSLGGGLDGNGYYAGRLDITNNVVYNWGSRSTDGGANKVNFVNNYYKPGAGTTYFKALNAQHEAVGLGMQQYYFAGNVMPGYFDENSQSNGRVASGESVSYTTFLSSAFFPSYVTTQTAKTAYKQVLSDVGCSLPVLDDHDVRIVNEALNGTYTYTGSVTGKKGFPDDENDVGGYESYPTVQRASGWDSDHDGLPNWWESLKGTNVNSAAGDFSDANADADGDGYTQLDDYLQWMATPHYNAVNSAPVAVTLNQLAKGFTASPSYTVSGAVNGAVTLASGVATFTPSALGLGAFSFTVTDAEGATMTRKINILNTATAVSLAAAQPVKTEETETGFLVWPVPNQGHFSALLQNVQQACKLFIYDAAGKLVESRSIAPNQQESLHLKGRGMYVLKVASAAGDTILFTRKVLVQ
ncbi:Por secretion system C-terminal sorting domain-containing protein [Filimonas lacunae]|uniref:Por secretion system C-terminal sorting domain-containing protein n=1 Tax=Filimonas lacunae TaxID=477680 RepID=A0A1N7QYH9_9BACT|nr:T9SS type A sorting domain-containing protein [Filimonas lacunae]SIT27933.1 Por secretion system C-terminal sorting domain-containing protein [Filimonas lacunae]